jgi:flagellar hook-associated protein 2
MGGSISSLGLGAGILTSDVIDKLKAADTKTHLDPITRRTENLESKQTALDALITDIASLKAAQNPLSDELTFLSRSAEVSGNSVGVQVEKGVEIQDFSIKVNQLARPEVYQSFAFSSKSDKILDGQTAPATFQFYARIKTNTSGTNATTGLNYTYIEKHVQIEIDADMTWADLTSKISSETEGSVKGLIVNTGGSIPFRLIIQSNEPGIDNKVYMGNVVKADAIADNYYSTLAAPNNNGIEFLSSATAAQFKINGATKELFTKGFTFTGFDQTITVRELENQQRTIAANTTNLFETELDNIENTAVSSIALMTDLTDQDSAISKLRTLETQLLEQIGRDIILSGSAAVPKTDTQIISTTTTYGPDIEYEIQVSARIDKITIPGKILGTEEKIITLSTPAILDKTTKSTDPFEQKSLVTKLNHIIDVSQAEQVEKEKVITQRVESIRDRLENMKKIYGIDSNNTSDLNINQYNYLNDLLEEIDDLQNNATTGTYTLLDTAITNITAGVVPPAVVAPPYPEDLPEVVTMSALDELEDVYGNVGRISEDIINKLSVVNDILKAEEERLASEPTEELKGLDIIAHMINFRSSNDEKQYYTEYKDITAYVSDDGRQLILNDANGDLISASGDLIQYFGLDANTEYTENVADFTASKNMMDNVFGFESIQKAQNSEFEFNGVTIKSNKNKLDDLIIGVEIQLQQEGSTEFVKIKGNNEAIEESFTQFVDAYNVVVRKINELTDYNEESKVTSALQGESDVNRVASKLSNAISKVFEQQGFGPNTTSIIALGISRNRDGTIALDANVFRNALERDANDIQKLFDGWKEERTYTISGAEETFTTFHDGFFQEMNDLLKEIFDGNDSILSQLSTSYRDRIDRLKKSYDSEKSQIDTRYETMAKQFAAYDSIMSNLERSFASLKQQIDSESSK